MNSDEVDMSFINWSKKNVVPFHSIVPYDNTDVDAGLKAIGSAIGDARVVALSEGCHNSGSMMSLHHRIITYLVENCGFTIVATETGLPSLNVCGSMFRIAQWTSKQTNRHMSMSRV